VQIKHHVLATWHAGPAFLQYRHRAYWVTCSCMSDFCPAGLCNIHVQLAKASPRQTPALAPFPPVCIHAQLSSCPNASLPCWMHAQLRACLNKALTHLTTLQGPWEQLKRSALVGLVNTFVISKQASKQARSGDLPKCFTGKKGRWPVCFQQLAGSRKRWQTVTAVPSFVHSAEQHMQKMQAHTSTSCGRMETCQGPHPV